MEIKPTKMTTQILTTIINEKPCAYACMLGEDICGTVCFYDYLQGTLMIYEIQGLLKRENGGFYGFHIHEGELCGFHDATPFESTKGHYNPMNVDHPMHLGDLPPLFATKGRAWGIVYIDKFQCQEIIDRTLVIHEDADDFHTQPSGHSGNKIACGEIKRFQC